MDLILYVVTDIHVTGEGFDTVVKSEWYRIYVSETEFMMAKQMSGWDIDAMVYDWLKANSAPDNIASYIMELLDVDYAEVLRQGFVINLGETVGFVAKRHWAVEAMSALLDRVLSVNERLMQEVNK